MDGGLFFYEEALELVRQLNSADLGEHLGATVTIWERNGSLRILALGLVAVLVVAVIALV